MLNVHPDLKEATDSNVYINNLPKHIDNKTFHDLFSQAGTIAMAKFKPHGYDKDRKIGFVLFEDIDSAEKCVKMFHNSTVFDSLPLKCRLWKKQKDIKKRQKEYEIRSDEMNIAHIK